MKYETFETQEHTVGRNRERLRYFHASRIKFYRPRYGVIPEETAHWASQRMRLLRPEKDVNRFMENENEQISNEQ